MWDFRQEKCIQTFSGHSADINAIDVRVLITILFVMRNYVIIVTLIIIIVVLIIIISMSLFFF